MRPIFVLLGIDFHCHFFFSANSFIINSLIGHPWLILSLLIHHVEITLQHFTLFNVIAFSIRENNNQEIQRYDLHKEVNHELLGISK